MAVDPLAMVAWVSALPPLPTMFVHDQGEAE
jgi:hypothetical protein